MRYLRTPLACVAFLLVLAATLVATASPSSAEVDDPEILSILAVGDSYTAGNGAGDYFDTRGCRRSANNYAREYQRIVEARYGQRAFVETKACSGTVTKDFANPYRRDRYLQPPMFDAVNGGYDLIFLTIGGNDLNFAKIVEKCFVDLTQEGIECGSHLRKAEEQLETAEFRRKISDVLTGIRERARTDAKIVLLGYPYLEGNENFALKAGGGRRGDNAPPIEVGKRVRALGDRGDQVQQSIVNELNGATGAQFVFVNTKATFAGPPSHELFAPNNKGDDSPYVPNPDRWMIQPWTDADIHNRDLWYHPNRRGHHEEAELLVANPDIWAPPSNGDVLLWDYESEGDDANAVKALLEADGYRVELTREAPASLDSYEQVWLFTTYGGVSTETRAELAEFVLSGGSLLVNSEHSCCDAANRATEALMDAILTVDVTVVTGCSACADAADPVREDAIGDIDSSPNPGVTLRTNAVGWYENVPDQNQLVLHGGRVAATVWGASDTRTGNGRLVTVADSNWTDTGYVASNNAPFVENVAAYLQN